MHDELTADSEGRLQFISRTDAILNRGGEKFSLEQIEDFLKKTFNIDSICVASAHARLGEELGILLRRRDEKFANQKVFTALSEQFGRTFDQQRVLAVDELPINDQSKLDRKSAARLFAQEFECRS
jgi:acyl-CoA synthetase (AMP-forming)/AMP-acid ligase II